MAQQPQPPQPPQAPNGRANTLAWMTPLGHLNDRFWREQVQKVHLQGLLLNAEATVAQQDATINAQQQRINTLELQVQNLQDAHRELINDHRLFVSQVLDAFEADRDNTLYTLEFFRGLLDGNVPDNAHPALQARAAIIENPGQPVIEPGANHGNRQDERNDRNNGIPAGGDRNGRNAINGRNERNHNGNDMNVRDERKERNEGNERNERNERNDVNNNNQAGQRRHRNRGHCARPRDEEDDMTEEQVRQRYADVYDGVVIGGVDRVGRGDAASIMGVHGSGDESDCKGSGEA